jgi:ankyrin repeat protein
MALHGTAKAGSQDTVQSLINAGADVKATDKDRRTALHDATQAGFSNR